MGRLTSARSRAIRYLRHRRMPSAGRRLAAHSTCHCGDRVAVSGWSTFQLHAVAANLSGDRREFGHPAADKGRHLDLSAAEQLLPQVRLAAAAHSSNVLGTVNDIPALAKLTSKARWIAVRGRRSQGICHETVDVNALNCDFMRFFATLWGPLSGIGASYARTPGLPSGLATVWWTRCWMTAPPLRLRRNPESGTQRLRSRRLPPRWTFAEPLPEGWQAWEDTLLSRLKQGLRTMDHIHVLGQPRRRSGCLSLATAARPL